MKLLIVDDEVEALEGMQLYFSHRGHEVFIAQEGLEALNLAKAGKPDLMLLDLKMKEISGFEVMEKVRKFSPFLTIVVITGLSQDDVEAECKRLGAAKVLHKPLKVDDLDELIEWASTK